MKYKTIDVSKLVGFHRRCQPIPSIAEIEAAWRKAEAGELDGAIRILDWRRHCFLAKDDEEREALAKVMDLSKELFE